MGIICIVLLNIKCLFNVKVTSIALKFTCENFYVKMCKHECLCLCEKLIVFRISSMQTTVRTRRQSSGGM